MNEYMITTNLVSSFSEEFIAMIPEQRAQVNRLMEKGILTSYSLSADRRTLWITLLATSRDAAERTLQMMPMHRFMQSEIIELLFHNAPVYAPMKFSVN